MKPDMKLAELGLFAAKVPRYTSYPTAAHFSHSVNAGTYSEWLGDIPPDSDVSLYIHIPFCRRLCWFCACRTQGTTTAKPVAAYLETLAAEIDLLAARLPSGLRLARLHWGGGTPTLLDAGMITDLVERITTRLPLAPDAEFSVEIDPNEIDQDRIEALAGAGMTRASIGVQDFDPEIQKIIGREQSFGTTESAVKMLRAAGIDSLNTDILFGLPYQTRDRIATSVQKLLSLAPDRVALYGYAHVPWMARRQCMIPSDTLPTPEERLELFETAQRLFEWDGYRDIGIDHFARPADGLAQAQTNGTLRRNFQGYTDDQSDVLIGLGASAISRFPQGFAQNAAATSDYARRIGTGEFATARGHVFDGEDDLRGRLIERLMCDFEVRLADFAEAKDRVNELFDRACAAFPGVLFRSADALQIPRRARPLTRMIAGVFDAYAVDAAGHSHAF